MRNPLLALPRIPFSLMREHNRKRLRGCRPHAQRTPDVTFGAGTLAGDAPLYVGSLTTFAAAL